MNFLASLAVWYVETNLLVAATGLVALPILHGLMRTNTLLPRRELLRLARVALVAAVLAPAVSAALPRHHLFRAADDLWGFDGRARTSSALATATAASGSAAPATLRPANRPEAPSLAWPPTLLLAALGACMLVRLTRTTRDVLRLRRIKQEALPWRAAGRLRILVGDTAVPLSFATSAHSYVLLPRHLAEDAAGFRIALRHEVQHHRHGDLAWLTLAETLALLFPLQPLLPAWRRLIVDLQEFACDEALVGQRRCDAHAYGSCLIRVTEAALTSRTMLVGTAGMSEAGRNPGRSKRLLERRLVMLTQCRPTPSRRLKRLVLGTSASITIALFACAYAAKGARAHEPLTLEEAKKIVAQMNQSPDVPLQVNDKVLTRLNRYITEPGRREKAREALARMQALKPMITSYLERYDMPEELLAVPLVESGYQNLPQATWQKRVNVPPVSTGAGLWMFIKHTARAYGLVVNETVDQRLDPQLETDAAMRLLAADRLRFKDWLLALAAYEQGEGAVQSAIEKGGTRDAWTLVEQGHLDEYIATVTAGWILLSNPQLVE